MRAFQRTIRGGNSYTINTSSSALRRRHKLTPVIEGLESRVVLSSASAHLLIQPSVIAISSVASGTQNLTAHGMDTGGTYSNQPSPA
jgi:hypothetical protein